MEKKKLMCSSLPVASLLMVILWSTSISPAFACSQPPDARGCKGCIVDQMKHGCPSCTPILRCMARCLWSGTSRSKCAKRCDCNGGMLTLSDGKKCMSRCKCSCVNGM